MGDIQPAASPIKDTIGHLGASMGRLQTRIARGFARLDCEAALHVRALSTDAEVGVRADELAVMASVFKPIVALEFYAQAAAGELDPAETVQILPAASTPGPVGISNFLDPATMSLGDLAFLMLTISDNAATDVLMARVGLDRVNTRATHCGCTSTLVASDLQTMLTGVAVEMGFSSYADLVRAQSGEMGEVIRLRSIDPQHLTGLAALDPSNAAARTTARDMTQFLASVWRDRAAPETACRRLREVMARQVTRRLEGATPDGGTLAAKSGGLFGRVRNEIGVITYLDGQAYAFAVLTRSREPFVNAAAINLQMGRAVDLAIGELRAR
jgi:beta-lactamase class A